MEISKENLLRINRGFGGNIRSGSSIDYAIDMQKEKRIGDAFIAAYIYQNH